MPSHIIHPIPPVFDTDSRILILGSFPSVKSRESCFFYGHPQNRFWKLLARLRKEDIPSSVEEKKAFLLRNHIAVWDTIHSCSIEGSSDSSIRDVVPNDLASILDHASIQAIYTNGGLSGKTPEAHRSERILSRIRSNTFFVTSYSSSEKFRMTIRSARSRFSRTNSSCPLPFSVR